jgi:hypothetical protein
MPRARPCASQEAGVALQPWLQRFAGLILGGKDTRGIGASDEVVPEDSSDQVGALGAVLDRIDEIAPPGTDAGPNDVAYTPPAISSVGLRRRPVTERSAA